MTCEFCKEPVSPEASNTYRLVSGWEQRRRQGGLNKLTLRETHDRFAHSTCIRLAQLKVSPDQPSLFAP